MKLQTIGVVIRYSHTTYHVCRPSACDYVKFVNSFVFSSGVILWLAA